MLNVRICFGGYFGGGGMVRDTRRRRWRKRCTTIATVLAYLPVGIPEVRNLHAPHETELAPRAHALRVGPVGPAHHGRLVVGGWLRGGLGWRIGEGGGVCVVSLKVEAGAPDGHRFHPPVGHAYVVA